MSGPGWRFSKCKRFGLAGVLKRGLLATSPPEGWRKVKKSKAATEAVWLGHFRRSRLPGDGRMEFVGLSRGQWEKRVE